MREFRAKTTKKENREHTFNNVWVEGDLVVSRDKYYIHPRTNAFQVNNELAKLVIMHEVIPETVGQYTGLTDKNGTKIFDGDILYIKIGHGECVVGKAIVCFDEKVVQYRVREIRPYAYDSKVGYKYRECDFSHIYSFEVIGNIHDNHELLKGEEV